ncbi:MULTISPECIES: endonuclease domain-containing protein [Sphingobium]|jgi:very-short-patch-repair endonuclease|uniref:endonuclease domain-containing protein n=1 Tax=Sphingobium TaxID=165695 RepID=UPI000E76E48B|nr:MULTISPECIES: endonuclease domain-containing protein [Sphingobium]KAA9019166.1 endonuclease domain-containing protein [Sphingobium limneticum]MBU0932909.1 endonuclease domain-containing protein [Alphaproteobacteria bacterium]
MPPVRRQISPHAAPLRQHATDVEQKFWAALRNRQLDGFKFRRQATIGPFIVDFLCVERRLIIELDGGQHNEDRDLARSTLLLAKGYRLLRIWNHDAIENFDGAIEAIRLALIQ